MYLYMYMHNNRRRRWHPTPVLLPGKSHGQRSLVGCGPWGREESDTTERLPFHFPLSCIGEGNGNPLQCSCLENPRDGGAWWPAVCGVTQSQTRLKWLSSSSSMHNNKQKEMLYLCLYILHLIRMWSKNIRRYIYICIYIYMCVYIYIYMLHTHVRTHTQKGKCD